jgi:hypothetical protein
MQPPTRKSTRSAPREASADLGALRVLAEKTGAAFDEVMH